ncbi:MAG: hypothetical protein F4072_12260 [Acidimicrobiaceae bacterium]|nr:hypothetical protein [Acidimicrobiaceae bacterium]
MSPRLRSALAIVLSLAFVAAACGGEVSVSVDDDEGTAAPTTAAPAVSEPDADEPDDSGEAPAEETTTTEPDDEPEAPATTEPDDEPEAPATTDEADEEPEASEEETTTTEPAEPEGPPPNIYNDPRGGVFAEYQASMDRGDHPFMQIDAFCNAHPAAADRVATDKA